MAQSKFPLEISLRGRCLCRLRRGPHPHRSPPRKYFCRAKMPCGGERLSGLLPGSLIVERIAYRIAAAIQNESAGKKCRSARQYSSCQLEPLGSHKGSQTLVLCCAASATKAISSRRLDTALLCAAKKRGVEKGPAGRSLPEPPLVLDHGSRQKASRCRRQQKKAPTFVDAFSF